MRLRIARRRWSGVGYRVQNLRTRSSKCSCSRGGPRRTHASFELLGAESAVFLAIEVGALLAGEHRVRGHVLDAFSRSNQRMSSASRGRAPNRFVRIKSSRQGIATATPSAIGCCKQLRWKLHGLGSCVVERVSRRGPARRRGLPASGSAGSAAPGSGTCGRARRCRRDPRTGWTGRRWSGAWSPRRSRPS
jgi:hypothetical protein